MGCCLLFVACSGGDDDTSEATTDAVDAAPTTVAVTTTTEPAVTTTTAPELVTEGATVVVANASIVGGSAGRMTDELASSGFTTGEPTNATLDLEDSIVHYELDNEAAQAVAESLGLALGGVAVQVLPEAPPTESGDVAGEVLVLLGNNQADRTLDELTNAVTVETAGAVVVVANASGVSGSAGRMTAQLDRAGFEVGEATNADEQLADSIVYFTDAEGAEDDATLLATAFGGVDVEPLPDPAPIEGGELDGDVLLLLGTNQADQPLSDLNP